MVAKLHFIPALMVGAALLFTPHAAKTAPSAPSLDNLKGKYDGVYIPDEGSQGVLKLTISQDKRMRNSEQRRLKAVAKFGNKAYKLNGSFEPVTKVVEFSAIIGRRPPNITMVTLTGIMDASGTTLTGGYSITRNFTTEHGDVSLSR